MFDRPSIKRQSGSQVRAFLGIIIGGSLFVGAAIFVWNLILSAIIGAIAAAGATGNTAQLIAFINDPMANMDVIANFGEILVDAFKSMIGILAVCAIVNFIGSLLTVPFTLSFAQVFLNVSRDVKPELADFFGGYKQAGKAIALQVLITIFTSLWSLLFIIPGIVKSISYSLSFYVLADRPELTALEALNISKELTKGHKMEIFITYLSFIGWFILCSIPYVGQILQFAYVTPYLNTTMAHIYRTLSGRDETPNDDYSSYNRQPTYM
jgi:uncharacterized membrane protein